MKKNFLSDTVLFSSVAPEDIDNMLSCLGAWQKSYKKGETIYNAGDTVSSAGLVLSGSVAIESNDVWGNCNVLDSIGAGEVFAETYACMKNEPLMVNVVASEASEILFLDIGHMLTTCEKNCEYHHKLVKNLLMISAGKNLALSRKIFHTSSKSIRGRLMSYLSYQATAKGSNDFTIPFNRQQLADYLNVDRSALSKELGKMQRDGLIKVERNHFSIE